MVRWMVTVRFDRTTKLLTVLHRRNCAVRKTKSFPSNIWAFRREILNSGDWRFRRLTFFKKKLSYNSIFRDYGGFSSFVLWVTRVKYDKSGLFSSNICFEYTNSSLIIVNIRANLNWIIIFNYLVFILNRKIFVNIIQMYEWY